MVMSMTTASTTVSITGEVTATPFLPQPNSNQEVWSVVSMVANAGTVDIHTPASGKRSYLSGIYLYNSSDAVADCSTKRSGNYFYRKIMANATEVSISFGTPIPFNVDEVVRLTTDKANIFYCYWGYDA